MYRALMSSKFGFKCKCKAADAAHVVTHCHVYNIHVLAHIATCREHTLTCRAFVLPSRLGRICTVAGASIIPFTVRVLNAEIRAPSAHHARRIQLSVPSTVRLASAWISAEID